MSEENKIERYRESRSSYGPTERVLELRHPSPPVPFETGEVKGAPELLTFWHILQKRYRIILLTLFVILTGVLVGTLLQTPIYRAKALIEFEEEDGRVPTLQEVFDIERISNTYLETQYKILQSESLSQRVIDELRLETHEEFNKEARRASTAEKGVTTQGTATKESLNQRGPKVNAKVLKAFQGRLHIAPVLNSRLVAISFESQDPQIAADAVNSLTANYSRQIMEANQQATEWLSGELGKVKEKLEHSEAELNEYARSKDLLFLQGGQGAPENIVNQRLRHLQQELTEAQAARFEKEALFRLVERGDFAGLPGAGNNRLMQDLTLRLADLKRGEAQLAATFSREYPKVKEIRNQINELERELAKERKRAAKRIANEYHAAVRREALVRRAFYGHKGRASQMAEGEVQYNILGREVKTQKQLYDNLLQRVGRLVSRPASRQAAFTSLTVPGHRSRP